MTPSQPAKSDEGFVPTPAPVTDFIVSKLFVEAPDKGDTVLLPGAGTGQFAAAIQRYCSYRGHPCPEIHAVEKDSQRAAAFEDRFATSEQQHHPNIPDSSARQLDCSYPPDWSPAHDAISMTTTLHQTDFLTWSPGQRFDYIVANPPFIKYNSLEKDKREHYADRFETATGRYNLYAPFIEKMCDYLADDGNLICILPDQFLFSTNDSLRRRLREETLHPVWPLPDDVFQNHTVQTCLVEISADPNIGVDGKYAVHSWHWPSAVEELLEALGVGEKEATQQVETYFERVDELKQKIPARRRTYGTDGGYASPHGPSRRVQGNSDRQDSKPSSQQNAPSEQQDLGAWM